MAVHLTPKLNKFPGSLKAMSTMGDTLSLAPASWAQVCTSVCRPMWPQQSMILLTWLPHQPQEAMWVNDTVQA